jgi:hypothetical protein
MNTIVSPSVRIVKLLARTETIDTAQVGHLFKAGPMQYEVRT